ncbi:MAG TPA: trypsin-like peptidase domain-containing protein [Acidimicrobiales bacterium]|nr:trypsin-like peptidase domain-containing protein [Acidimicrobiales bacterium]
MSETFDPDQTPRPPDAPGEDAPGDAAAFASTPPGAPPPAYPPIPGAPPSPGTPPPWAAPPASPPPPPAPAGAEGGAGGGAEGPPGMWVAPGPVPGPGRPWDPQAFWSTPARWGPQGQWGPGQWGPGQWPPQGGWAPPPGPAPRPHPLRVVAVVVAVALVAAIGVEVGRTTTGTPGGLGTPQASVPSQRSTPPAASSTIADKIDPGVVDINTELGYDNGEAAGTGMVIESSGVVLTNNHVIDGATSISVTDVGNGQTYTATVVGSDSTSDVAVLRLAGASGLRTVPVGDSSSVAVGDAITAVGNAEGAGGTPSTAAGSVTALDQAITAQDESENSSEQLSGLIQTDAILEPGDSGGPLVDGHGKVVGMDTAASSGFQFQAGASQGFSIPINQAMSIARQILSGKSSSTIHIGASALIGVRIQDGTFISGAQVVTVQPDSPASQAGIVVGDVITGLAGQAVDSASSLSTLMRQHHPGDAVKVVWVDTSGQQHSAVVHLATGPAT